ncbi:MAG TPA: hypothetical protein VGJ48_13110 [Pyrinomonadaceae bacterium]|jgi:hypothetical protein
MCADHPVVQAAKEAFKARVMDGCDVSTHTRNAQAIAKAWRTAAFDLDPSRYRYEVPVRPEFDQRIDVLDQKEMCAFEFKVSGKNATSEFYKDVVKVLLWNERHSEKIKKLVFITEESCGRRLLDSPMPQAFIQFLRNGDLAVEIVYVQAV